MAKNESIPKLNKPLDNRIVGHEMVAVDQLLANPRNWRLHPRNQQQALAGSIDDVGFIRSITVNKVTGAVVDGHARVTLAARSGVEALPVEYVELSEADEAKALALLDPISAMAEADTTKLDELLRIVNSDDARVQEALSEIAEANKLQYGEQPPEAAEPEIDRAEELRVKWGVELGQMWRLPARDGSGEHRLICGDCTDRDVVGRVMGGERAGITFSDPPFGISYTGHGASFDGAANKFSPIDNDDKVLTGWIELVLCDAIYLKTTWRVVQKWVDYVEETRTIKSFIVWDKCSHVAGNVLGGYATQSEIIIYCPSNNHKINKFDTDVWRIPRATTGSPKDRTGHPYESPVELPSRAIENSSTFGDIVYDPFSGSGTTIIAAENLHRYCRAVEISPGYVAVALQRYQDTFQVTPELMTQ